MQSLKRNLLYIAFIALFALQQQSLLSAATEEELTIEHANPTDQKEEKGATPQTPSTQNMTSEEVTPQRSPTTDENQNFIQAPSGYQPNNVVEITGHPNFHSPDLTNKTPQEQLVSNLNACDDVLVRFLDTALMSKTASILVPKNVLSIWINMRKTILNVTPETLQNIERKLFKKRLEPYEHRPLDKEYAAALNKKKDTLGTYNLNLFSEWFVYHIKNSSMFLLIPSFANLKEIEKFFCISNNLVCKQIYSAKEFSTYNDVILDRIKKTNQLTNQANKQPKNKSIARALARKNRALDRSLTPDLMQESLHRIFQPNSSEWIFLRLGHGSPASPYIAALFCGITFATNFARANFLGTEIKTFINFDITCFGGAEHAKKIGDELHLLSKNNKEFTPYIYGIYALTADSTSIHYPSFNHHKMTQFFSHLRNFKATKNLNEFKAGVENLFEQTPYLKSYEAFERIDPNINTYGIDSHPLIFIPKMKNFTALPSADFAVFNDPHAKPDTENKKAILLYSQEIDLLQLHLTNLPNTIGKDYTNCLPPIISMCATQPSSIKKEKEESARFCEIKKLITPTSFYQLIEESFSRSADTQSNYFLIRELHCNLAPNESEIMYNVIIYKNPHFSEDSKKYFVTAYYPYTTIKQPEHRWENTKKEIRYYKNRFKNTRSSSDTEISKKSYDEELALALSFKTKKNPSTYQKPLKALGKWMEGREK